ncbi:MAG: ATP-binding protein [Bacteroidales bacterium]
MSTKRKISLLFSAAIVLYIIGFVFFEIIQHHQHKVLYASRYNILKEAAETVVEINENSLSNIVKDYTNWNEMIEYVHDKDPDWAKENLETILQGHKANVVWVYNLDKESIFFINNISPDHQKHISLPDQLLDSLFDRKVFDFYLSIPEGVFLVSGATVHKTFDIARKQQPQGYLFIGKRFDQDLLKEYGQLTGAVVSTYPKKKGEPAKLIDIQVECRYPLTAWDGKIVSELIFLRDFPYVDDFFRFSRLSMILFIGIGLLVIAFFYILFSLWISGPLSQINHALLTGNLDSIDNLKNKPNEFGHLSLLLESFISQKQELERQMAGKLITEKLLLESEEKFSKAFLFSPAAMMISSLDTREIITVNESFSKITGLRLIDLINKTIESIGVFTDPGIFNRITQTGEEIDTSKAYEIFLKTRSEELRFGILQFDIVHLQGNPCLLSVIVDITDRKQVEIAMNVAKEKAEESDSLKYYLLLNMSHELRTPLTGIIGFAEVIKDDSNERIIQSLAEKILISSDRLLSTLNSIMLLAEIHSGKLKIYKEKIVLQDVLSDVLNKYALKAKSKSIDFVFDVKDIIIETDPEVLVQISERILDNAVKFSETGVIKVTVENRFLNKQLYTELVFEDTGIGIPVDKLNDVFHEFRQLSEGVGRSFEGSGLGLSIAKYLTILLGGEIMVESALNAGTKFTVRIPLSSHV